MPGGGAELCMGQTPTASVMLRLAKRSDQGQGKGKEAAGIEMAKKMGAQVEVKTDGPITCSTMIPPKGLEQYGFNTTCSVLKNGQVAAIEVTAKSQKDMVAMDSLHKIAEKMAGRFYAAALGALTLVEGVPVKTLTGFRSILAKCNVRLNPPSLPPPG